MNIKVCIANYGNTQLWCLEKMLEEFKKYIKYKPDITLYTTENTEYHHYKYDSTITTYLPYECRKHMVEDIEKYDLFLYNENDHIITEDNIDALLEYTAILPHPYVSGFYRYEINNGKKILVDFNPYWGKLVKERLPFGFSVNNNHQGCFLLTKKQLKHCIDTKNFTLTSHDEGPYGRLEQGATDPYNRCGLTKVFPYDMALLERLGIWHLPVKYSLRPDWMRTQLTYLDMLKD